MQMTLIFYYASFYPKIPNRMEVYHYPNRASRNFTAFIRTKNIVLRILSLARRSASVKYLQAFLTNRKGDSP